MDRRALATVLLVCALFVPGAASAADGGADADVDGATDASSDASGNSDGSTDASTADASKDAGIDAPVTSDGGPITFRPDADAVDDAGTPVNPPADDGGCNAAGGAAGLATGWPLVLALAALFRRRRRA